MFWFRVFTLLIVCLNPAAAAPREFTVATYNVFYRNPDLPKLAAVIRETRADLVALQETNGESEKFLRRQFAGEYPHIAFRWRKGSDGFGFLSKAPLRKLEFLEPLPGWRGTWFAEVELGGTNAQIVSVHLATPQSRKMTSLPGAMTMFQEVEEIHAREMARIFERMSRRMPVIVLGDFNSFSFFHAPKFLVEHGFTDSFAAVTENADRQGTWRHRSGESEWRFRIDYIFHGRELRTRACRILQSGASDHSAVVSRMAWVE